MTDELKKALEAFIAATAMSDVEISIVNKKHLVCKVQYWNSEGSYYDTTDVWFSKADLKAAMPLLIQIIDALEE